MKFIFLLAFLLLSGCGSGESPACSEVDTSRAPDSIITNGNTTTYTWGNCTKVYYTNRGE